MKRGPFQATMRQVTGFEEISVTLSDGYRAYARCWSAPEPRGAVLYHHGIQSHCGWYEASPAALARAGYFVLQVDRRGCGRNRQDRGHAESAEQLIGDALTAGDELTRRSGFTRYHVIGVSWGGKLAVAAHVSKPVSAKSLSLVTPGLFPRVGASRQQMAKIGFAMLYQPRQGFDIPLNKADLFTTVPRWREFFRKDPLTLRQCTAGFYLASRRMDKVVVKLAESEPVPIHLMLAGDEYIIDNDRTRSFISELKWPKCRVTVYDGARHSLEYDVPEAYLTDVVSFIDDAEGRCE